MKQREPFQAALWLMGTTLAKEADWLERIRASTQTPLNARDNGLLQFSCLVGSFHRKNRHIHTHTCCISPRILFQKQ